MYFQVTFEDNDHGCKLGANKTLWSECLGRPLGGAGGENGVVIVSMQNSKVVAVRKALKGVQRDLKKMV